MLVFPFVLLVSNLCHSSRRKGFGKLFLNFWCCLVWHCWFCFLLWVLCQFAIFVSTFSFEDALLLCGCVNQMTFFCEFWFVSSRCCFRVSAARFPVRPIEMAFQVTLIALFGNVLSSKVLVPPGMLCFAVLVLYPIFFRTSAGFVCVAVVGLGDWSSHCLGLGSFLCIIPGFFCFLLVVLPVGFVAAGDGSLFSFCMVVRLVFVFWGANFLLYCFLGLIYLFSYLLNCLFTAQTLFSNLLIVS